jgi:hypothetical protein
MPFQSLLCESWSARIWHAPDGDAAMPRHGSCCIPSMALILIFWVFVSVTFCLALLRAAARPLPCCDNEAVMGSEEILAREPEPATAEPRAMPPGRTRAFPAPCATA